MATIAHDEASNNVAWVESIIIEIEDSRHVHDPILMPKATFWAHR